MWEQFTGTFHRGLSQLNCFPQSWGWQTKGSRTPEEGVWVNWRVQIPSTTLLARMQRVQGEARGAGRFVVGGLSGNGATATPSLILLHR